MSRTVTLVLVGATGAVHGALPPFEVDLPWWPEVSDVIAGARERYGVDVDVLRILSTELPVPHGGAVTYLAEVVGRPLVALSDATVDRSRHPLRASYADLGGPAASVAWATATLRALGRDAPIRVSQRRTWNLSAIWRLDCPTGTVWLKHVPAFLTREATVLAWLDEAVPGLAPHLIATDGHGRSLLADAPGEDRFDAPPPDREVMAQRLHTVQLRALDAVDDLLALGIPDDRGDGAVSRIRAVAEQYGAGIDGLSRLLDELPERLAAIRVCGVPDTLVHGDFHPGNVRDEGTARQGGPAPVVIDWGEVTIGHPGADILRLTGDLAPVDAEPLMRAWARRWVEAKPGCDPQLAIDLLPPVQALLGAVLYATFLAQIERSCSAATMPPTSRPAYARPSPWPGRSVAQAAPADQRSTRRGVGGVAPRLRLEDGRLGRYEG